MTLRTQDSDSRRVAPIVFSRSETPGLCKMNGTFSNSLRMPRTVEQQRRAARPENVKNYGIYPPVRLCHVIDDGIAEHVD